jgi:hypothetical protein
MKILQAYLSFANFLVSLAGEVNGECMYGENRGNKERIIYIARLLCLGETLPKSIVNYCSKGNLYILFQTGGSQCPRCRSTQKCQMMIPNPPIGNCVNA